MRSEPYKNVSPEVREVVSGLMQAADEYHKTHEARLARTIELIYEARPEGVLLEIGTSGFIPIALKKLLPNLEVWGTYFDTSLPPVTEIEVGVGAEKMMMKVACLDLEHEPLPINNSMIDHVICCEVLEHMEIDPMYMLGELNRVSKESASLLLTTPNVLSSRGLTKMMNGIEPYFFMQYHKNRQYNRHNYEYSARTLRSVLTAAGYDVTVWSEDLFEDPMPNVVDRLSQAGFTIQNTGDNLIATGRKISGVVERYPSDIYV